MKNYKNRCSFIAILMTITILFIGCGRDTNQSLQNKKENVQQVTTKSNKQVLNMPLAYEPESLDASKLADGYAACILSQALENLVTIEVDKDGKSVITPAAAESWELSKDGLEWTFHIRDAKWSDGVKVTAKDFAYGIKRIVNPKTASSLVGNLVCIKNVQKVMDGKMDYNEIGVKAVDDKTLKISLEYPVPYFLEMTTDREFYPHRKDLVEKYGTAYGSKEDTLVFNGPFKIDNWVHNSKVQLSKNESYWDKDNVKLDKVNFHIIDDENALMGEFQNNNIDICEVAGDWVKKLNDKGTFDKITLKEPTTSYVYFNGKNKLLSNTKIRQALSISLDREQINNTIYGGVNTPGYGWVAPPTTIDGQDFRKLAGDPVQKLIDENPDPKTLFISGLKELGMNEDTSKITIKMMIPGQTKKDFGEYLQQVYKEKLGINLELDICEWSVFLERTNKLDYEMAFMCWGADINDPFHFFKVFISDAHIVSIGWKNKEYDDLVKKASVSLDPNERIKNYVRAEEILVKEDCAVIPYGYLNKNVFKQKYVKGLMLPEYGSSMILKHITLQK